MTELQWLFAILVGLYLWECLGWVRRGGVAFSKRIGKRWHIQHPTSALGNHNGGFVFAPPFPPLRGLFIAYQPPFSLGPDGVLLFVANNLNPGWRPTQSGRFLKWPDVESLRIEGKKFILAGKRIFTAPTTVMAVHLHRQLMTLAKISPDKRVSAIRQTLSDSLDDKKIETLMERFDARTKIMRLLTNGLFIHVFAIIPLVIALWGIKTTWLLLLLVMLSLTISIATMLCRIHGELYSEAKDERFTHTLTTALAPATSMRAHDIVSRPLLVGFHPVAVAKLLIDEKVFRKLARAFLLDLRNPALPRCNNPLPEAIATELFFRGESLRAVEAWLKDRNVQTAELCRPPVQLEASCVAYCPRCEAQFTTVETQCMDCGGIRIVSF